MHRGCGVATMKAIDLPEVTTRREKVGIGIASLHGAQRCS